MGSDVSTAGGTSASNGDTANARVNKAEHERATSTGFEWLRWSNAAAPEPYTKDDTHSTRGSARATRSKSLSRVPVMRETAFDKVRRACPLNVHGLAFGCSR